MTRRPSLRRKRGADAPDAPPPVPSPDAPSPPAPDDTTTWTLGTPPGAEPPAPPAPPADSGADATAVHQVSGSDQTPAHEPAAPVVLPPPDPSAPAGLEAQPGTLTPSFRDRGRLRRRLRYLRRVRELGFRDLGGLVFDLHRFGRDGQPLVTGKLEALAAVDLELRALETALQDREDFVVLREPGIGACTRCAALHGSDANFCPNCGLRFSGPQAIGEVGDAPLPPAGMPQPAPVPAPPAGPTWNWPEPALSAPPPAPEPANPPKPKFRKQQPAEPEPETVSASEAGDQPVSSGLGPLVPEEERPTTVQPAVDPDAPFGSK